MLKTRSLIGYCVRHSDWLRCISYQFCFEIPLKHSPIWLGLEKVSNKPTETRVRNIYTNAILNWDNWSEAPNPAPCNEGVGVAMWMSSLKWSDQAVGHKNNLILL